MIGGPARRSTRSRYRLWEHCGQLREHWYVACTSQELGRRRVFAATVLGLGVVVFRCRDGSIAAILDQCLHRATELSSGRLEGDCVVCPYHGWRYDAAGRVVHVPTVDGARAPSTPHPYTQQTFPTHEAYGLVWVYMGEGEAHADAIFEMPFWGQAGWVTYYMVSAFDGDVGALAQNFMDVPHTVHVHGTIFRKSSGRRMRTTVALKPHSVEVEYHEARDSIGLMPWLTNPHRDALEHTDKFFSPNITRCDYHWGSASGFVITSQMTPEDESHCRVYTLISYRFPLPAPLLRLLRPVIHAYTRVVIDQDVRIMRANRRGLANAPEPRLHNVQADTVHVGIERLIAASRQGTPLEARYLGARPVHFEL